MSFKKIFWPGIAIVAVLGLVSIPALAGHHEGGEAAGKVCPVGSKAGCDKGGYAKSDCGKGSGACAKMSGCCSKDRSGKCGKYGKGGCKSHAASPCPISSKFCKKVCWIMEHQEELGLTEDQIARIKSLDLQVEKNTIRGMAEMKVFALEIENAMNQPEVDVQAVESMIDTAMAGMALSTKATVKAYADLKAVATPEQKAKARELKKSGHEGHHHHKSPNKA